MARDKYFKKRRDNMKKEFYNSESVFIKAKGEEFYDFYNRNYMGSRNLWQKIKKSGKLGIRL